MRTTTIDGAPSLDVGLAAFASAACGCGAVIGLAGAAAGALPIAVAGGVLVALGIFIMITARWVDGLLLLLLALPLPALYSDDAMRIAPAVLLNLLLAAAWMVHRTDDAYALPRRVPRATVLLLGTIVLAALFAEHRAAAARELVSWLLLAAVLLIATESLRQRARLESYARVIGVLGAVCGILAVLEMTGVLPGRFPRQNLFRAALGFGWPNELAMFFALTLPFTAYVAATARGGVARMGAYAGIACVILGLIATFSRGAWLAVLMSSLLLCFAGERRFVFRVWVIALVAGLAVDSATGGAIAARIASTAGDWVVEQRAALTLAGMLMFVANPVLGVGPGGFADSLEEYGPGIPWLWDYLPTAQNAYVQMAAETGVLGLVALLIFLLAPCVALLRAARLARGSDPLRRTVLWAAACAMALGFVEWIFAHGVGQLVMVTTAMSFAVAADPDP